MLAKVLTSAVVGMDGALVEVEVDIASSGLPNFLIVGRPDTAAQEARERVRAPIRNSGLAVPIRGRYLFCGHRLDRRRRL
jgi:magnesium chelatase family protein